jgi:hypothetical protein
MLEHIHLLLSEPQRGTSSDGTAPLKPKDGLSGPPVNLKGCGYRSAEALRHPKANIFLAYSRDRASSPYALRNHTRSRRR